MIATATPITDYDAFEFLRVQYGKESSFGQEGSSNKGGGSSGSAFGQTSESKPDSPTPSSPEQSKNETGTGVFDRMEDEHNNTTQNEQTEQTNANVQNKPQKQTLTINGKTYEYEYNDKTGEYECWFQINGKAICRKYSEDKEAVIRAEQSGQEFDPATSPGGRVGTSEEYSAWEKQRANSGSPASVNIPSGFTQETFSRLPAFAQEAIAKGTVGNGKYSIHSTLYPNVYRDAKRVVKEEPNTFEWRREANALVRSIAQSSNPNSGAYESSFFQGLLIPYTTDDSLGVSKLYGQFRPAWALGDNEYANLVSSSIAVQNALLDYANEKSKVGVQERGGSYQTSLHQKINQLEDAVYAAIEKERSGEKSPVDELLSPVNDAILSGSVEASSSSTSIPSVITEPTVSQQATNTPSQVPTTTVRDMDGIKATLQQAGLKKDPSVGYIKQKPISQKTYQSQIKEFGLTPEHGSYTEQDLLKAVWVAGNLHESTAQKLQALAQAKRERNVADAKLILHDIYKTRDNIFARGYVKHGDGDLLNVVWGIDMERYGVRGANAAELAYARDIAQMSPDELESLAATELGEADKVRGLFESGAFPNPWEDSWTPASSVDESSNEPIDALLRDGEAIDWIDTLKTSYPTTLKPSEISVYPKDYQYKTNTDAKTGANQAWLDDKKEFLPGLSETIDVWQDPDTGEYVCINGHHRLALAKARNWEGDLNVRCHDVRTKEEARVLGALLNIQQRKGTAIDGATILREMNLPKEVQDALGFGEEDSLGGQAQGIANLEDGLYRDVIKGRLTPRMGGIIGASISMGSCENAAEKQRACRDYMIRKGYNDNTSYDTLRAAALTFRNAQFTEDSSQPTFFSMLSPDAYVDASAALQVAVKKKLSDERGIARAASWRGSAMQDRSYVTGTDTERAKAMVDDAKNALRFFDRHLTYGKDFHDQYFSEQVKKYLDAQTGTGESSAQETERKRNAIVDETVDNLLEWGRDDKSFNEWLAARGAQYMGQETGTESSGEKRGDSESTSDQGGTEAVSGGGIQPSTGDGLLPESDRTDNGNQLPESGESGDSIQPVTDASEQPDEEAFQSIAAEPESTDARQRISDKIWKSMTGRDDHLGDGTLTIFYGDGDQNGQELRINTKGDLANILQIIDDNGEFTYAEDNIMGNSQDHSASLFLKATDGAATSFSTPDKVYDAYMKDFNIEDGEETEPGLTVDEATEQIAEPLKDAIEESGLSDADSFDNLRQEDEPTTNKSVTESTTDNEEDKGSVGIVSDGLSNENNASVEQPKEESEGIEEQPAQPPENAVLETSKTDEGQFDELRQEGTVAEAQDVNNEAVDTHENETEAGQEEPVAEESATGEGQGVFRTEQLFPWEKGSPEYKEWEERKNKALEQGVELLSPYNIVVEDGRTKSNGIPHFYSPESTRARHKKILDTTKIKTTGNGKERDDFLKWVFWGDNTYGQEFGADLRFALYALQGLYDDGKYNKAKALRSWLDQVGRVYETKPTKDAFLEGAVDDDDYYRREDLIRDRTLERAKEAFSLADKNGEPYGETLIKNILDATVTSSHEAYEYIAKRLGTDDILDRAVGEWATALDAKLRLEGSTDIKYVKDDREKGETEKSQEYSHGISRLRRIIASRLLGKFPLTSRYGEIAERLLKENPVQQVDDREQSVHATGTDNPNADNKPFVDTKDDVLPISQSAETVKNDEQSAQELANEPSASSSTTDAPSIKERDGEASEANHELTDLKEESVSQPIPEEREQSEQIEQPTSPAQENSVSNGVAQSEEVTDEQSLQEVMKSDEQPTEEPSQPVAAFEPVTEPETVPEQTTDVKDSDEAANMELASTEPINKEKPRKEATSAVVKPSKYASPDKYGFEDSVVRGFSDFFDSYHDAFGDKTPTPSEATNHLKGFLTDKHGSVKLGSATFAKTALRDAGVIDEHGALTPLGRIVEQGKGRNDYRRDFSTANHLMRLHWANTPLGVYFFNTIAFPHNMTMGYRKLSKDVFTDMVTEHFQIDEKEAKSAWSSLTNIGKTDFGKMLGVEYDKKTKTLSYTPPGLVDESDATLYGLYKENEKLGGGNGYNLWRYYGEQRRAATSPEIVLGRDYNAHEATIRGLSSKYHDYLHSSFTHNMNYFSIPTSGRAGGHVPLKTSDDVLREIYLGEQPTTTSENSDEDNANEIAKGSNQDTNGKEQELQLDHSISDESNSQNLSDNPIESGVSAPKSENISQPTAKDELDSQTLYNEPASQPATKPDITTGEKKLSIENAKSDAGKLNSQREDDKGFDLQNATSWVGSNADLSTQEGRAQLLEDAKKRKQELLDAWNKDKESANDDESQLQELGTDKTASSTEPEDDAVKPTADAKPVEAEQEPSNPEKSDEQSLIDVGASEVESDADKPILPEQKPEVETELTVPVNEGNKQETIATKNETEAVAEEENESDKHEKIMTSPLFETPRWKDMETEPSYTAYRGVGSETGHCNGFIGMPYFNRKKQDLDMYERGKEWSKQVVDRMAAGNDGERIRRAWMIQEKAMMFGLSDKYCSNALDDEFVRANQKRIGLQETEPGCYEFTLPGKESKTGSLNLIQASDGTKHIELRLPYAPNEDALSTMRDLLHMKYDGAGTWECEVKEGDNLFQYALSRLGLFTSSQNLTWGKQDDEGQITELAPSTLESVSQQKQPQTAESDEQSLIDVGASQPENDKNVKQSEQQKQESVDETPQTDASRDELNKLNEEIEKVSGSWRRARTDTSKKKHFDKLKELRAKRKALAEQLGEKEPEDSNIAWFTKKLDGARDKWGKEKQPKKKDAIHSEQIEPLSKQLSDYLAAMRSETEPTVQADRESTEQVEEPLKEAQNTDESQLADLLKDAPVETKPEPEANSTPSKENEQLVEEKSESAEKSDSGGTQSSHKTDEDLAMSIARDTDQIPKSDKAENTASPPKMEGENKNIFDSDEAYEEWVYGNSRDLSERRLVGLRNDKEQIEEDIQRDETIIQKGNEKQVKAAKKRLRDLQVRRRKTDELIVEQEKKLQSMDGRTFPTSGQPKDRKVSLKGESRDRYDSIADKYLFGEVKEQKPDAEFEGKEGENEEETSQGMSSNAKDSRILDFMNYVVPTLKRGDEPTYSQVATTAKALSAVKEMLEDSTAYGGQTVDNNLYPAPGAIDSKGTTPDVDPQWYEEGRDSDFYRATSALRVLGEAFGVQSPDNLTDSNEVADYYERVNKAINDKYGDLSEVWSPEKDFEDLMDFADEDEYQVADKPYATSVIDGDEENFLDPPLSQAAEMYDDDPLAILTPSEYGTVRTVRQMFKNNPEDWGKIGGKFPPKKDGTPHNSLRNAQIAQKHLEAEVAREKDTDNGTRILRLAVLNCLKPSFYVSRSGGATKSVDQMKTEFDVIARNITSEKVAEQARKLGASISRYSENALNIELSNAENKEKGVRISAVKGDEEDRPDNEHSLASMPRSVHQYYQDLMTEYANTATEDGKSVLDAIEEEYNIKRNPVDVKNLSPHMKQKITLTRILSLPKEARDRFLGVMDDGEYDDDNGFLSYLLDKGEDLDDLTELYFSSDNESEESFRNPFTDKSLVEELIPGSYEDREGNWFAGADKDEEAGGEFNEKGIDREVTYDYESSKDYDDLVSRIHKAVMQSSDDYDSAPEQAPGTSLSADQRRKIEEKVRKQKAAFIEIENAFPELLTVAAIYNILQRTPQSIDVDGRSLGDYIQYPAFTETGAGNRQVVRKGDTSNSVLAVNPEAIFTKPWLFVYPENREAAKEMKIAKDVIAQRKEDKLSYSKNDSDALFEICRAERVEQNNPAVYSTLFI